LYTFETGQWQELVTQNGAGWDFDWSPDSKSIAYRGNTVVRFRKITAIKTVNIANTEIQRVSEKGRRLSTPRWINSQTVAYLNKGKFRTAELNRAVLQKTNQEPVKPIILQSISGYQLKTTAAAVQRLNLPDNQTFNVVLAPASDFLVFEKADGWIYRQDLSTEQNTKLACGEMPKLSPDGAYIVFATPQDDGDRITGSDLWISSVDGTFKQALTTTEEVFEMHPDWSPDGTAIAFENDGYIHLLRIKWSD
ncbi:PD40 domain-containing protein, partial [bacterium]|nr:PD40 domain-containing protein [bacterium]